MKTVKMAWRNLLLNPRHAIIGFFLITNGIVLMSRDDYFFWPPIPFFLRWANDDAVGFFGVMIGVALIIYSLRSESDNVINALLLACASGYLFVLSLFELVHAIFAKNFGMTVTFTAVFCLFLEVLALAKYSDTTQSSISNKEADKKKN